MRSAGDERSILFDQSYDGFPPADFLWPTCEQIEFDEWAAFAASEFAKCANYPSDAWTHLSHAVDSLCRRAQQKRPERLSGDHSDRLIRSILEARFAVARITPQSGIGVVMRGFDGLFFLASHLGETDEQRASRHPDKIRDALAYARVLQNCAHNECIARDIQERAERRRGAIVADIINSALGAAS